MAVTEGSERDVVAEPVVDQVLEAVDGPALVCDREGVVRSWNEAFADCVGDETPVDGARVDAFVDWAADDPVDAAVSDGTVATAVGKLRGNGRPDTVTVRPLTRESVVGAVVRFDDVGAEWPLHEAGFAAAPDTLYVVDTDHRIRLVSDAFESATGVPTEAVTGRRLDCLVERGIVDEASLERAREALDAVLSGRREAVTFETRSTVDGDTVVAENRLAPVTHDGEIVGAVAVVQEVTERSRTERALSETRERLRTILDTLPVAMLVVDADGRVDRVQGFDDGALDRGETELRGADLADVAQANRTIATGCRRALDGEASSATATVGDRTFEAFFEPVRTDGSVTGAIAAAVDVTDRVARADQFVEREQRLRAVIEGTPHPIAVTDTDGRYEVVNEALVGVTDASREELRGRTPAEVFPGPLAERVQRLRDDVLSSEAARVVEDRVPGATGDGERIVQFTVAPYHGPDGEVQGTVTIARDVTERERQRDELETVTAIQRLVQESIRGVTAATTSAEIKETVCERLAASEFYRTAWIGSRAPASTEVTSDYAAGGATAYLDSVRIAVDASDEGLGPGGEAYRTGDVQVVGDVREDPAFEPWRDAALEQGFESVAVIPLTHGSTTHGILAVYTDRTESFGDREVAGFAALGEAVGFALSAAQHRRLLKADRLLELEFVVTHDGPFLRASADRDCRFVFENAVHASDGRVVNYLTVEGADPAVGAAAAEALDTLESIRRLDGDDGPDFELKWRRSVYQYLAEAGARGTRGTIEDGVGRMVVEAPGDIDVHRVTEAMETRFGDVELRAKRERDRAEVPWWRVHGDIGATLTDRQRAVLQAAYYSGYYEWPRDVDAETLAETLDVASTTLLQHLRKGHGRVLEALFDS